MIEDDFANRVLVFDTEAAEHFADLVVSRERAGKSIITEDAQIAAICRSHGATLATIRSGEVVIIELTMPIGVRLAPHRRQFRNEERRGPDD